jgi:hypothetical protein
LLVRLAEERREMIEAAPTALEERGGRVWTVRKLPPALPQ